jgi:hypothetical protein
MRDRTRWILLAAGAILAALWLWEPWSAVTPSNAQRSSRESGSHAAVPERSSAESAEAAARRAERTGAPSSERSSTSGLPALPRPEAGLAPDVGSSRWGAADGPLAAAGPLRSLSSDERVEPVIANTCEVPVELYWIDFDGLERSYGAVRAGATQPLATYRGHAWRVRTFDGAEVRSFVADGDAIETCDANHRPTAAAFTAGRRAREWPERVSARSTESARISIRNACEEDLSVFWVDFQGNERRYALLATGAEMDQSTFSGHLWRLRSADGREVESFRAEGDGTFSACEHVGVDRDA